MPPVVVAAVVERLLSDLRAHEDALLRTGLTAEQRHAISCMRRIRFALWTLLIIAESP